MPVIDWLLNERQRRTRSTLVFDQCCRRLAEVGVPLDRATFHSPELHPQIISRAIYWDPSGGGALEVDRKHGIEETHFYQDSPIKPIYEGGAAIRRAIGRPDCPLDFPIVEELKEKGFTDYTIRPLPFSTGRINALSFATRHPDGFSDLDIATIDAVLPALGAILEVRHVRRTARSLLDVYVGPRSGGQILSGAIKRGSGEVINAVLWYCDLRNFTELSERLPIDALIELLDEYFEHMASPVEARGGEVLKFIGDSLLAIFPISEEAMDPTTACRGAIAAAEEALTGLAGLNQRRKAAGQPGLRCGIALHMGDVMYGNVGAPNRLDFTVIGPAVNLVTRIEAMTRDLDPPIVISREVAAKSNRACRSLGQHRFKGIDGEREVLTPMPEKPAGARQA